MRFVLLLAAVVSLPGPGYAQPMARPNRLGLCAACHGETGQAQLAGAPNLAGQRLDYLRSALAQYRRGERKNPLMQAALGPISDAELEQLARWYSAQSPTPPAQVQP